MNTTQALTQYHNERWCQNGTSISINNPKYNSTVFTKQNGELLFTIEISNVSTDDLGDYIGIIEGDFGGLISWCNEYLSFLPIFWGFFYGSEIPTAVTYSSLEIFSKCML